MKTKISKNKKSNLKIKNWLNRLKKNNGGPVQGQKFLVLVELAKYFNSEGRAYVAHETLVQKSGASLTTVKMALRVASMNGFLEIRDHHNDIGRQLTNDYYMLDPDPLAPKGGEVQEKDDSEEVQSETTAEDSCLVAKDKNDAPEKQKAGGAKLQSLEG